LTMTMLYSVNIRVLGNRANVPLLNRETILTQVSGRLSGIIPDEYILLVFFVIVTLIIKAQLDLFFRTDLGLTIGAMGNNEQMVISQGVNPKTLKSIGLGLSTAWSPSPEPSRRSISALPTWGSARESSSPASPRS